MIFYIKRWLNLTKIVNVKMGTKLIAYMIYKIGPKSGSPLSPSRIGHYILTAFQPPLKISFVENY